MAEDNKRIIEEINKAFEDNKPEVFLDYCTEDVRWEMAGDEPRNGKNAIREFMSSMGDMEPPKINVTQIISEGSSAACYGDMTMIEKGTEATYSYCDIYRFAGGKVAELRTFVVKHKTEGEAERSASA
jgi:ketosteroid isomerase-like protein